MRLINAFFDYARKATEYDDLEKRYIALEDELADTAAINQSLAAERGKYKRKWEACKKALVESEGERAKLQAEIDRVRSLITEAVNRRASGAGDGMIDPLLRSVLKP